MRQEISSGGVIVYRSAKKWDVLLIRDMNGVWTFPKGLIEKDENSLATAKREIAEEVGLTNLKSLGPLPPIEYFYRRSGLIHKRVYYFLFQSDKRQQPICQEKEGIKEAQWVDLNKALNIIGYAKSNTALLKAAQQKLNYGN